MPHLAAIVLEVLQTTIELHDGEPLIVAILSMPSLCNEDCYRASLAMHAEIPEAMADLSDNIEKLIPCTATEHTQDHTGTVTEHA